jgi:transporter family-2 protein
MCLAGVQLAPQAPLNRGLAQRTSGVAAAFVSFLVGLLLVAALCAIAGELGRVWGVWHAPAGQTLGGLLGATFVLITIISVNAVGAGGVAALAVTGQLAASLVLDAGGALGLAPRTLTATLLVGVLAVLAGTYMVLLGGEGGGPTTTRRAAAIPVVLMVLGGAMLGIQHPLNGDLARSLGDLPASVVNFAVGAFTLFVVVVLSGRLRSLAGAAALLRPAAWVAPRGRGGRSAPPTVYLLGGVLGGINATAALTLVDTIGAGGIAAAAVSGQVLASLALDRAGALGLRRRPLSRRRLLGAALVVAGTVLVAI